MNLRSRLLLFGFFAFLIQGLLLYGLYQWMLAPQVSNLEKTLVEKNLHRNLELLQRELFQLEHLALLFAELPLTSRLLLNENKSSDLNELEKKMSQLQLNSVFILDKSDKVLSQSLLDLNTEQALPHQRFLSALFEAAPSFFEVNSAQNLLAGIYNSPLGPALMVCAPIFFSSEPHQIKGTLIVGRLITQEVLQLFQSLTLTEMKLWPLAGAKLSAKHLDIIRQIQKGDSDFLIDKTKNAYWGYMTLPEINRKDYLLFSTLQAQDFTEASLSNLFKISGFFIFAQIILLGGLFCFIHYAYVTPSQKLVSLIEQAPQEWQALASQQSWKEMYYLANAFSVYMVKQQNTFNQEVQTAYRQGLHHARQELCVGLEEVLRLVVEGIESMEKKLSNLPTNEIERIIAQNKTSPLAKERALEIDKLQIINEHLRMYQKEMRAKLLVLHNKSLRNAVMLRSQSHHFEPTKQFTKISSFS